MSRLRTLATALVAVAAMSMCAIPVSANPGNGNGNGNSGNHGNSGNKGNSSHSQKGNPGPKNNSQAEQRKAYGKPDHVDSDISYNVARHGLTGYKSLPPGIAKNLARGKPLPPGIAKKSVPSSMLNQLPYYPGYEWQVVGDNLVLIALSTAIVTAVINGVFD